MAKRVKSVEVPAKQPRSKWLLHAVGVVLLAGVVGASIFQGRRYAEAKLLDADRTPQIVLKDAPAWMNDDLKARLRQIATPVSSRSALNHDVLVDISEILRGEPWVKKVKQVRRIYGQRPGDTIEVECDYRQPVALVEDGGYFWMVDADGVKLPERYAKGELARVALADERPKLRVITGVAANAPQAGESWTGPDLRAGIELISLLQTRRFATDVAAVDVTNFAGRHDPQQAQIVLHTLKDFEIRWGRPVSGAKDFFVEVSVDKKLEHLETIANYLAKADGTKTIRYPWYDVRREKILVDAGAESRQATLETP
jgi:hypothetical protein